MEPKDFFISYNKADHGWATWIAATLEQAGYTTVIEAWDFRPGGNFALAMQDALRRCDRVVATLSPDYLQGPYAATEWASAYATDPTGARGRLVPVMVRDCAPEGLLATIIHINLIGLDEQAARSRLLGGLSAGRDKPLTAPAFPGLAATLPTNEKTQDRTPSVKRPALVWETVDKAPHVVWRTAVTGRRPVAGPLLEIHLVPVPAPSPLLVRELDAIGERLVSTGRATGLFTLAEAVTTTADRENVAAFVGDRHVEHGLVATRSGQCGGWVPLPRDGLGAVLDEADVTTRLLGLLTALRDVVPSTGRLAVAVGVDPVERLQRGDATEVGKRNHATLNLLQSREVRWTATDSVLAATLHSRGEEIAAELAARVVRVFT